MIKKQIKDIELLVKKTLKEEPKRKIIKLFFIEDRDRDPMLNLDIDNIASKRMESFMIACGNSLSTGALKKAILESGSACIVNPVKYFKKKDKVIIDKKGNNEGILLLTMDYKYKTNNLLLNIKEKKEDIFFIEEEKHIENIHFDDLKTFWDAYNSTIDIWKDLSKEEKVTAEMLSIEVIRSLLNRHV